jgi:twitching motility protein PilT
MERERVSERHIDEILRMATERGASDVHLTVGVPPQIRVDGRLVRTNYEPLRPEDVQRLTYEVLNDQQIVRFEQTHELDFSYGVAGLGRFRVNLYMQRGCIAAAFRMIPTAIPSFQQLGLPPLLREIAGRNSGLILVTGPTGCGKSTTQACMINHINHIRECHIVTIEDPIEYLHAHKKAMINQRELGADTLSFEAALRAVLREDPDVILIGEMRDLDTISTALTLAETGHLVFGTLHTRNAPQTIDRLVDVFPPHQQDQIRILLAHTLEAVIAQQLLPRNGFGRVPAVEILLANAAIRNLIREAKTHQIYSLLETSAQQGMQTMDRALAELVRSGQVSRTEAAVRAIDQDNFNRLCRDG